jgi:hypothetical protein
MNQWLVHDRFGLGKVVSMNEVAMEVLFASEHRCWLVNKTLHRDVTE